MTEPDYNKIYENWETFPQCKIRIAVDGNGESLWGRQLDGGLVGLDNNPLDLTYRWQDIVIPQGDVPQIIHRRWNSKFWFRYEPMSVNSDELEQRKQILDRLRPLGRASFFVSGMGYVLVEHKEKAYEKVKEALDDLDYILSIDDEDKES